MLMWAVYPHGSLGREGIDEPLLLLLQDEVGENHDAWEGPMCSKTDSWRYEGYVVKPVDVRIAPVRKQADGSYS